ncbi:MAG: hypothetical protein LBJ48_01860 [Coriobacteriales bacterium]|jgi:hypothetical protein|nr:hypothetical protein [Coriobacteriales bacterium]
MQISWFSIALLIAVFVIGPLLGILLSRSKNQGRAMLAAFAALFASWLVFVIVVEVLGYYSAMPFIAVASVFIPVAVYYALMQILETRASRPGPASAGFDEGTSADLLSEQLGPQAPQSRVMTFPVDFPEVEELLQSVEQPVLQKTASASPSSPVLMPIAPVISETVAPVMSEAAHSVRPPASAFKPLSEPQAPTASVRLAVTEALQPHAGPRTAAAAPEAEEVSPKRHGDKPASIAVSYQSCYRKAARCADRGYWPLSAALYEESSYLTDMPDERSAALFAAMYSYLKAKKLGDVKRLIVELQTIEDLSPAQLLKLRTIRRMLP